MPINTEDLTTQDLEGTGILDVMLNTVKLHLKREFDEDRIRGNDYAQTYATLVGAALQSASGYAIQKPLTDQQLLNEAAKKLQIEAQTANIVAELPNHQLMDDKTQAEINFLVSQKDTADEQKAKIEAEGELLAQKLETEKAQTQDIAVADSVIGKQITLYTQQAQGYVVDQNVKVAKLFGDTANLQLNVNENYDTATNGLADLNIKKVMDNARVSVGAT